MKAIPNVEITLDDLRSRRDHPLTITQTPVIVHHEVSDVEHADWFEEMEAREEDAREAQDLKNLEGERTGGTVVMNTFTLADDDLKDLQSTGAATAKAPVPTPTSTANAAKPATTPDRGEFEDEPVRSTVGRSFSLDDESLERDSSGLERIRPKEDSGRAVRFNLLDYPVFPGRIHWVNTASGKQCRLCLSLDGSPAPCCNLLGEDSKPVIMALCVEYTNANADGKYPKTASGASTEFKVGYFQLTPAHLKTLKRLLPEGDNIRVQDLDYIATFEKKRYAYSALGKARWKQVPVIKAQIEATAKGIFADGGTRLERRLGKKTTLGEWKALFGPRTHETGAPLEDLEGV